MNILKNFLLGNYLMRRILSPTIIFSLLLILLSAWPGWGATYYIDPTCPSSGDGTTTTCGTHGPFKRWAEVTWAAGNTYSQKGGTTVYETIKVGASGTAGNVITINSYGTGKAIIDGAITQNPADWYGPNENGHYYKSPGVEYLLMEDGIFLKGAWGLTAFINGTGECTPVPCGYVDWHWSGDGKYYYKPTSGVFSASRLKTVRYNGINLGYNSYITIDGLSFRNLFHSIGAHPSTYGQGSSYITVKNCNFSNANWGVNIYTATNSTNIIVTNNTCDYVGDCIELTMRHLDQDVTQTFSNSEIAYNTITNCSDIWTPSGPILTYTWLETSRGQDAEGIGTQNLRNSSIHHNTISGYCRGYVAYVSYKNEGYNNDIYSNYIKTRLSSLVLTPKISASSFYGNKVHHNILLSDAINYTVVLSNITVPTASYNYFYNNTIKAKDVAIRMLATSDYWEIKNNIIYNPYRQHVNWTESTPRSHFIFDYNLYYPLTGTTGAYKWYYNPNPKTWTTWRELGFDANSPTPSDPLFTNGSGTLSLASDFTLQSNSHAKWAGVDVGLATDYAGNPVHNSPSIGAYEYISTTRPAAPAEVIIVK